MDIQSYSCFLLTPTDRVLLSLRRYVGSGGDQGYKHYHEAKNVIGQAEYITPGDVLKENGPISADDVRWPVKCCHCDYMFIDSDPKQYFQERLYMHGETGELMTLRAAPVGAMWFAEESNEYYASRKGADGKTLIVRTPGGDWCIDNRATNCDSACKHCGVAYKDHRAGVGCGHYEDAHANHKCWVRHGVAPNIHVDKNGHTCGAGAGSFQDAANIWHGFLHHGRLHS